MYIYLFICVRQTFLSLFFHLFDFLNSLPFQFFIYFSPARSRRFLIRFFI
ncbi:unnamed protein product [Meloidogyne enterolobii]|uniref:Uncharacterized protein n=1 Tax=Meloidogyne enterolobii TaxID=390850 RepID=A0ACB1B588_MELEN